MTIRELLSVGILDVPLFDLFMTIIGFIVVGGIGTMVGIAISIILREAK